VAFLEFRPTKPLYHYTSVDGFSAILRSKTLWFSDLESANDPREIKLGYGRVMQALLRCLQKLPNSEGRDRLAFFRDRLIAYHDRLQVFCCCFSTKPDELPMWAAYGGNHSGISIGLRPSAILSIEARVQKVRYLDEASDGDFDRLVQDISTQLHVHPNDFLTDVTAGSAASAAIIALKHSSWAYENEVRMVHVQHKNRAKGLARLLPLPDIRGGDSAYWQEPLERIVRGRAVKYKAFRFGHYRHGSFDAQRAIKEAVLGPNCPISVAEAARLLHDEGFHDVHVRHSDCKINVW
jgi:hypothetical protein